MKREISFLVSAILAFCSQPAMAYDWMVEANVIAIEPTYVPEMLNFSINLSPGTCVGTWLHWQARGASEAAQIANVQAVLSIVQTAKAAGTKVRVYGNNSTCNVDFIHAL